MRTPKTNQANIRYSSTAKYAVTERNNSRTPDKDQMCPPSKRTAFVKIEKSTHKSGRGGYAPVTAKLAAENKMKDLNSGASSYNDFILYNYGAKSERLHASD